MKFVPEESPLPRLLFFAAWPLLVGALLLARLAPGPLLAIAHCPLRDVTGVPCPTCGSTLALTRLAAGQVTAALAANPLAAVGLVAFALAMTVAAVGTLVPPWRRSLRLDPGEQKTARWLAVFVVVLNWAWLILRTCRPWADT